MYPQPRPFFWWIKTRGYLLYMMREATGVFILLYLIDWIEHAYTGEPPHVIGSTLGLLGALGHAVSWLWLSAKIAPIHSNRQKLLVFIGFFTLWAVASYLIYRYLYV